MAAAASIGCSINHERYLVLGGRTGIRQPWQQAPPHLACLVSTCILPRPGIIKPWDPALAVVGEPAASKGAVRLYLRNGKVLLVSTRIPQCKVQGRGLSPLQNCPALEAI